MGRDDFSTSPTYSGTEVSNKPLIVEDRRPRGCTCLFIFIALVAGVVVYFLTMLDPVEINLELLAVDSPEVQVYAINNLAGLGDPRAVDALAEKLYSPDPDVRNAAAWALGDVRSPDGVDPLMKVVNTEADYDLSYYAVSSLLLIASRCPDGTPRGEACADDALADKVTDYLIKQAETDPLIAFIVSNSLFVADVDMRILTAQLLIDIATEDIRYILVAALEDGDERVRTAVELALDGLDARMIPAPEAVPPEGELNPPADMTTVPAEPSDEGLPPSGGPPKALEPVTEPL